MVMVYLVMVWGHFSVMDKYMESLQGKMVLFK